MRRQLVPKVITWSALFALVFLVHSNVELKKKSRHLCSGASWKFFRIKIARSGEKSIVELLKQTSRNKNSAVPRNGFQTQRSIKTEFFNFITQHKNYSL